MNEQIQTIIDRARTLLAAATPGPLVVGVGQVQTEDAGRHRAVLVHTDAYCVAACGSPGDPHSHADAEALAFAVNNLGALCDAVVGAEQRAEEAEAQAAAMLLRVQEISGDFNPANERENGLALSEMREALEDVASNHPAGRALLDRLHAAEVKIRSQADQVDEVKRVVDRVTRDERAEVLRGLADAAAAEQGLAQRRMTEAQEARNAALALNRSAADLLAKVKRGDYAWPSGVAWAVDEAHRRLTGGAPDGVYVRTDAEEG